MIDNSPLTASYKVFLPKTNHHLYISCTHSLLLFSRHFNRYRLPLSIYCFEYDWDSRKLWQNHDNNLLWKILVVPFECCTHCNTNLLYTSLHPIVSESYKEKVKKIPENMPASSYTDFPRGSTYVYINNSLLNLITKAISFIDNPLSNWPRILLKAYTPWLSPWLWMELEKSKA